MIVQIVVSFGEGVVMDIGNGLEERGGETIGI